MPVTHAQIIAAFNAGKFSPVSAALLAGYCLPGDLIWWPNTSQHTTVVYRPALQVFVVGTETQGEFAYTLAGQPCASFFEY